jgi:trk system potassium uptake protein TrkA
MMGLKHRYQVAVLGLGRFGSAVAQELTRLGHEVLAVDASAKVVQELADEVTYAAHADITDLDALKGLGLDAFDTAIVAVSSDLEVSILTTVHLSELGVKRIVAKAANKLHGSILQKVGATRVVYPEWETGFRVAHSFAAPGVSDYLDAAPGYGVARITIDESWVGKRLDELDLQGTCGLTAVLIGRGGNVIADPPPSATLQAGDQLIVHGFDEDLERLPDSTITRKRLR